jgi:excinuclease ABC subunit A
MWFLPSVTQTSDACGGSGYRREVASLVERGRTLADIEGLTIGELVDEWSDIGAVRRVGDARSLSASATSSCGSPAGASPGARRNG